MYGCVGTSVTTHSQAVSLNPAFPVTQIRVVQPVFWWSDEILSTQDGETYEEVETKGKKYLDSIIRLDFSHERIRMRIREESRDASTKKMREKKIMRLSV